ncbi:hypothetical protein V6N13_070145 [Hibiscus sabdariffa]|uniref:FAF domain-containing protein n=2 Tax=Hibiscus sabdariffa TaxID=183260 RepID=A0ABR2AEZ2_9ROSI
MATIVCHHHHQGLQSCLESQTVEPRALRLTLFSSRPHSSPPPIELASKSFSVHSSPEPGGWSSLQALFDGPRLSKEIGVNESTYVHPLFNPSLSALSDKSLELCTENLGSETGSDDFLDDDNDVFSLSSSSNPPTSRQHKSRRVPGGKKAIGGDFPPPLTTISGAESVRLVSYRENGRLVITAEKAPYNNTIFRAERSNGRLRLSILKDPILSIDYEEETSAGKENDNINNEKEEEFEDDSNTNTIAEEEEEEEVMGTTKFERRESRDGGGGGGCGGRCKGGEHEEQRMVKLNGYIHSFVLDLPV